MITVWHTGALQSREVKFVHLGLPEARFLLACRGHMHAFHRAGYRSGAFPEDARHIRAVRSEA